MSPRPISPPTNRQELKKVVKSSKKVVTSLQTRETLATGKIHIFWANKVEEKIGADGKPFIIHHGHRLAKEWQAEHINTSVVLGNLEGKNGIPKLNDVEKNPNLSANEKMTLCAGLSKSYAEGASGEVVACVFSAKPTSFFRKAELPILMANQNVSHVTLVSIENPKGTKYSKNEAYEILRDEWLESSIERFNQASSRKKSCLEAYKTETKSLAQEIVIAEQRRKELSKDPQKNKAGIKKEEERISRVVDLYDQYPELKEAIKKEEKEKGISVLDQIVSILSKKPSWRKQVRKTFSNLKRSVTSFFSEKKEDKTLDQSQEHKNTTAKSEEYTMVENPMTASRSTSSQDIQITFGGEKFKRPKALPRKRSISSESLNSLDERGLPSPRPTPNPLLKGNGSRTL